MKLIEIINLLENEYRMDHRAPAKDGNNTLTDFSDIWSDKEFNDDKFVRHYGDGDIQIDNESYKAMQKSKTTKTTTIYRSVPSNITKINDGDWITLSKKYAQKHGENHLSGDYESFDNDEVEQITTRFNNIKDVDIDEIPFEDLSLDIEQYDIQGVDDLYDLNQQIDDLKMDISDKNDYLEDEELDSDEKDEIIDEIDDLTTHLEIITTAYTSLSTEVNNIVDDITDKYNSAMENKDKETPFIILEKVVSNDNIFTDGNSINEWGYWK